MLKRFKKLLREPFLHQNTFLYGSAPPPPPPPRPQDFRPLPEDSKTLAIRA